MNTNPLVDKYIENAAPFARPILQHIRQLMHRAEPRIVETIKWGVPNFEYKGQVAIMASFKEHVGIGFRNDKIMEDPYNLFGVNDQAIGSLGKIRSLENMPEDNIMIEYIREAVKLNEEGKKPATRKTDFTKLEVPEYLTKALKTNKKAEEQFAVMSPGYRKEYIEWFEEAKTDATRQKRLDTALEWIAERKSRNWKYKK
jgi:uncharacterized protein YdeI (YjbR/CyaY-like superfamily)